MFESRILPASQDDLQHFGKLRWPDDESRRLWFHLAQTAPNGAWVAKDEGSPIGVVIAHALEDEWFLSELFVESSFRKAGLGMQLLTQASTDAGDLVRSSFVESNQIGGVAFLAHRGLSLQTPVFQIAGPIPREEDLARMAAGDYRFTTELLDPLAQRMGLTALDREIRGTSRPLDHQYFSAHAHGVGFYLRDEFVGYTYVSPSGRIGPMCSASPAYLLQFFAFAMAALVRVHGATWCSLLAPGTNTRIVRAAMRLGLAIESVRIFATDAPPADLTRYIGYHPLLF